MTPPSRARSSAVSGRSSNPTAQSQRLYQLKGDYAYGSYGGRTYPRYQYKVTDGGRIWYFVEPAQKGAKHAGRVLLERCDPGHPKETE